MLNRFMRRIKEKGQGLTEYVLIFAFIAGLAFIMFGSGGLKETLASTITKTNDTFAEIAAVFGGNKSYSYYFEKWRTASRDALNAESNDDRKEADKLGLAIIARQLLTLDVKGVQKFMGDHAGNVTSGYTVAQYSSSDNANIGEGGYSDVLIPLSYRAVPIDDQKDFFWLDSNKNQETVKLLADDIKVYDKTNKDASTYGSDYKLDNKNEARTRSTDRFFYSNDMITNASSNDSYYSNNERSIALRVHYDETGHVDHVNIAAVIGKNGNGDIAEGLNLKVTNDSITERNGPL